VNPAVWMLQGFSIVAQNCNSLNVSTNKNQDLKLSAIIGYHADIVLLSDIRLNGRDRVIFDKFRLSYKMYHHSSTNSRGVAVLFRNNLDYEILDTAADPQENALLFKVRINSSELIVGSVYGPNDNNCTGFFDFIRQSLTRWDGISCIIGGIGTPLRLVCQSLKIRM